MSKFLNHEDPNDIEKMPEQEGNCFPSKVYQKVRAFVPVSVEPYANTGKIKTKTCGEPIIISENEKCPDKNKKSCTFVIGQKLCIEIPIFFGAKTNVGEAFTDCQGASTENICRKCDCENKEIKE